MGFLKKLASIFSGGPAGESPSLYVYLRCQACGEPIAVRIDLRNDLSPEWQGQGGSDQPDYYTVRKVVVGRDCCYRPVEVNLRFDRQRRLESQRAMGGTILSEEEYDQAKQEWEARKSGEQPE